MNKDNERLMAILTALRKLPRWALILITLGVIIILGVAMFLLLPQTPDPQTENSYLNSSGLAFEVFLKLGVVVLIIIVLAIIIRRMQFNGRTEQSKQIQVLETHHLSPRQTLYLVNVNDQQFLIGATDQMITNLSQTNPVGTNQDAQVFAQVLDQAQTSGKSNDLK